MYSSVAVHDIMARDFVGVSESDALGPAAALLLSEDVDALVVLRGTEPVGMMSTRDALSALLDGADHDETTVGDVMSEPAPTVQVDDDLATARNQLMTNAATHLLVMDGGDLAGIVTDRDVLTASPPRPGDEETFEHEAEAYGVDVFDRGEAAAAEENGETTYSTQSVCEVCGALTPELANLNGQLVCGDCREM